jgi:DNA-binding transcriptional ArsR family regulator
LGQHYNLLIPQTKQKNAPFNNPKSDHCQKKEIPILSSLPGKSLEISMVLWFLKGVTRKHTVKLSGKLIRSFGVSRSTLYRGLAKMEDAGLISVQRQKGRSPMVTILIN